MPTSNTLVLLTDIQLSNYIGSLNLVQNSTTYNILHTMLLLPPATYTKAISAVAQGLITFTQLGQLPAMNAGLVDKLINTALGNTDQTTLIYLYKTQYLPASINMQHLISNSIGDASKAIASKYIDRWEGIVRPNYDLLKVDTNKFFSYTEVYVAYMALIKSDAIKSIINIFTIYHNSVKQLHPTLFQTNNADCPILNLITSLSSTPMFLELNTGGRAENKLLDWVVSESWLNVLPGNFTAFMEQIAYPAMTSINDPDLSGLNGVIAVYNSVSWGPLPATNTSEYLDTLRMSKIFLPSEYGNLFPYNISLASEINNNNVINEYLTEARVSILAIHETLSILFNNSASQFRTISGSPVGFLLAITNS
jgi:hypothetical protein